MPQISLYIDEQMLKKIESAAKTSHLSISRWVAEQLRSKVDSVYPEDYGQLFGSIKDETFKRHEDLSFRNDTDREQI